jgi:hypothetical protein
MSTRRNNRNNNENLEGQEEDIPDYDIEIVGLQASSNGRSCVQHKVCGEHVVVGDVLRLKRCVVTVDGGVEEAIKLVKIADGSETCTVGFVPRAYSHNPKIVNNISKFVQVIEIYSQNSLNTYKRRLAHQNKGMASASFLDDIPEGE